jgi:trehalose utilization protein
MTIMTSTIRVTVWGENFHEHFEPDRAGMAERYPDGMHGAIAAGLRNLLGDRVEVRTATRDQPEHGLSDDVLAGTDVLTWWGHAKHAEVDDQVVDRVHQRVLGGMGLLVLHSGHFSKIFTRLMGTTCSLAWRNSADTELVWTVAPAHPIAHGVPHPIVIGEQEMYGEYFDIPAPEELVFLSTFSGGEVFRSGCCWWRGRGKVFYFSPGDQDYPVYHHPDIQRVLANAVQWARPEPETDFAPPSVLLRPAPRLAGRLVTEEGAR